MTQADHADLLALTGDEAVKQFTHVPTGADPEFIARWIGRYEQGWEDGSCAGFVVRDAASGALPRLRRARPPRPRGPPGRDRVRRRAGGARPRRRRPGGRTCSRAGRFDELGLVRLELQIDVANPASERVAARAGYSLEGVRRSLYFKEGRRADSGIWSRLRDDLPVRLGCSAVSAVERRLLAREATISAAGRRGARAVSSSGSGHPASTSPRTRTSGRSCSSTASPLWNNFWYAGRYSFVTYSFLYYPLAAIFGIKVLGVATIAAAALGFTLVVWREWGPVGALLEPDVRRSVGRRRPDRRRSRSRSAPRSPCSR